MALYRHYTEHNIDVYVWNITETINELVEFASFTDEESRVFNTFSSQRRKKEWSATRALLRCVLGDNVKISYSENHAPRLVGINKSISISHTTDYVSIAISDFKCGIDIELRERDFEKVERKYINESEKELISTHFFDIKTTLAIIWCFKESLFKFVEVGEVDFKKDIQIENITDKKIYSTFRNKKIIGTYIIEKSYVITFC